MKKFTLEIEKSELRKLLRIFNLKFHKFKYDIAEDNGDKVVVAVKANYNNAEVIICELYEVLFEDFDSAYISEFVK